MSKEKIDEERLQELAKAANDLHSDRYLNAWKIGKILNEAKGHFVKPRGWQAWVKEHCNFSLASARIYKRIYDRFKDREDLVNKIPGTLLMIMAKEKFPQEAANIIFNHPILWERGMVETINEIYRAYKRHDQLIVEGMQKLANGEDVDLPEAHDKDLDPELLKQKFNKILDKMFELPHKDRGNVINAVYLKVQAIYGDYTREGNTDDQPVEAQQEIFPEPIIAQPETPAHETHTANN